MFSLAGPSSPVPLYVSSSSEYRGHSDWPRSHSLDPGSHSYNSIPRNKGHSSSKAKQAGHHQARPSSGGPDGGGAAPRDVFKGRVDFKSILRRFDPKDDERSLGTPSNPGRLLSASRDPPAMQQV